MYLKEAYQALIPCPKSGAHQGENISMLCLNPLCRQDNLSCVICKSQNHKGHEMILLNNFFDDLAWKTRKYEKKSEAQILNEIDFVESQSVEAFKQFKRYIYNKLQNIEDNLYEYFRLQRDQQQLVIEVNQTGNMTCVQRMLQESDSHELRKQINNWLDMIKISNGKISYIDKQFLGERRLETWEIFNKGFINILRRSHHLISQELKKISFPYIDNSSISRQSLSSFRSNYYDQFQLSMNQQQQLQQMGAQSIIQDDDAFSRPILNLPATNQINQYNSQNQSHVSANKQNLTDKNTEQTSPDYSFQRNNTFYQLKNSRNNTPPRIKQDNFINDLSTQVQQQRIQTQILMDQRMNNRSNNNSLYNSNNNTNLITKYQQPITNESFLCMQKQFNYLFSQRFKHKDIDVLNQRKVCTGNAKGSGGARLVLMEPSVEIVPSSVHIFTFKIKHCKNAPYSAPLAIGLCHKTKIENNDYEFDGDDTRQGNLKGRNFSVDSKITEHGCYLLTAAGFLRNTHEVREDMKKVNVRFAKGDKIQCEFNPFRRILKFTKLNTGESCTTSLNLSEDKLYLCVRISYTTDSVELINDE